MGRAAALSGVAGDHSLAQQIALRFKQGPAFILVSGCNSDSCKTFLDHLTTELSGTGRTLEIHSPDSSANPFDLVANTLGLDLAHPSASALAKHLDDGNTHLLCAMGEDSSPDAFEQLRQLSNLQPKNGYLGIVLCGSRTLTKRLPQALRQRITGAYRLDGHPRRLRIAAWGLMLSTLCIGAWLAYTHFPATTVTQPLPDSRPLLETSLKAGPFLAQPIPVEPQAPLTHVFQTEAEAEAALQTQAPAEKPDQE
jgi:hypothetical protein